MTTYLTRHEAAELLKVSPATLDRYAREGLISRFHPEGKRTVRFDRDEVQRLLSPGARATTGLTRPAATREHPGYTETRLMAERPVMEPEPAVEDLVAMLIPHCAEIPRSLRAELRDALDLTEAASRRLSEDVIQ